MNDDLTATVRSALPTVESVLSAALGIGVLLILLDSVGIDVIANLRESGVSDMGYIIYPVGIAVVSKAVERIREAFESQTGTTETEKTSVIE